MWWSLWLNKHNGYLFSCSSKLMLWLISYITCSIVLSVDKLTGLQNPNLEAHSIKSSMLCDALDCTQLRSSSFLSAVAVISWQHTYSVGVGIATQFPHTCINERTWLLKERFHEKKIISNSTLLGMIKTYAGRLSNWPSGYVCFVYD